MTAPSNLVSLRITEEDMAMLDARVGMDGARNRSDVIRQAIQQFLNGQPLVQGMDSVRIPLGHGDKRSLGLLYELQGTTPEIAAQEGLSLYIANAVKAHAEMNTQLEGLLVTAKESTMRREEYHE
ncbi:MAG: ribbon-helix-helix domain-containing protein [Candidatus Poseidoniaceae archaeon]|nr:ribbon-helix-helix domain-containing protein [Candidatus Poseidoniaceae archaeon]